MSLVHPDVDLTVAEALEAECRKVMAARSDLKRWPGTHDEQAEMVADIDDLLDQWAEAMDRG